MKKSFYLLFLLLLMPAMLSAQLMIKEEAITLKTATGDIYGVLRVPAISKPMPLAIIIAGSGPTDRNGNQPAMQNNSLKMLSEGLFQNNIASLCFDKRGIAASKSAMKSEADIRFDHYVADVREWIQLLSADKRFSNIVVVGHSEGAWIGMAASVKNSEVAKYVSIAGAGMPAADGLKRQLAVQLKGQPESVKQQVNSYIDKLQRGETIADVPTYLDVLFRPSVQPYLISFFKFDPLKEIAQLTIPVLLLQGATDIQVTVADVDLLAKAYPKAKKEVVPDMNHVLKHCVSTEQQAQLPTYTNPSLPICPEVVKTISRFILEK